MGPITIGLLIILSSAIYTYANYDASNKTVAVKHPGFDYTQNWILVKSC